MTGGRQAPRLFWFFSFTFLQRLLCRGRGLRGTGVPTRARVGSWQRGHQAAQGPPSLGTLLARASPRLHKLLLIKCSPLSCCSRLGLGLAWKIKGPPQCQMGGSAASRPPPRWSPCVPADTQTWIRAGASLRWDLKAQAVWAGLARGSVGPRAALGSLAEMGLL